MNSIFNFVQFSVAEWAAHKKKVESISQDNSTDIRKWFKKKETSKIATNVRNTEKDTAVAVIN